MIQGGRGSGQGGAWRLLGLPKQDADERTRGREVKG